MSGKKYPLFDFCRAETKEGMSRYSFQEFYLLLYQVRNGSHGHGN